MAMMMSDKEILKAFNKSRKRERNVIMIRPRFGLHMELLNISAALAFMIMISGFRSVFSDIQSAILIFAVSVLFLLSQTKNIILLMIFLYQRFAPMIIREACLFTPSCSEYMRLSVQKYGVIRGVKKGLKRLRRCHPPNGGIDEP